MGYELPPEILASMEFQMRTKQGHRVTHLPVFEGPHRVVAVVDVARPWSGKGQLIKSVPRSTFEEPAHLKLGELGGSDKTPVVVFTSVKAACKARWLHTTPIDGTGLPKGTDRMLCLLQLGSPGDGIDVATPDPASGGMVCTSVMPLSLSPIPDEFQETAQPRSRFWCPSNGTAIRLGA
jgi:hypothetical protein